jgi:hypothetical protein
MFKHKKLWRGTVVTPRGASSTFNDPTDDGNLLLQTARHIQFRRVRNCLLFHDQNAQGGYYEPATISLS